MVKHGLVHSMGTALPMCIILSILNGSQPLFNFFIMSLLHFVHVRSFPQYSICYLIVLFNTLIMNLDQNGQPRFKVGRSIFIYH